MSWLEGETGMQAKKSLNAWRIGIALAAFAATTVQAQTASDALGLRYGGGVISSVEMAEQALTEVGRERQVVEANYLTQDRRCQTKFFTTPCQELARETRRHALAQLREIEIEAHTLQRRTRANARDKELADKKREDEAATLLREKEMAEKAAQAKPVEPAHVPTAAEVKAEEKKRADNVAAYEKKQRDAAIRLRERDKKPAPKP
jgi:colicin import membrane protein